jgi:hydrogenase maturation protease
MIQESGEGSRILVYGIGNPGRQDDGLGPALVEMLEAAGIAGIDLDANYQLNVEDALACSQHDSVIFADASETCEAPYAFTELEPAREISFTTHELAPAAVLALSEDLYGKRPNAWTLAIRGYAWDIGVGLSPLAEVNLSAALAFMVARLNRGETSETR